jgi:hypothetical protein
MAFSSKGIRLIVVNGFRFNYKISKLKKKSKWRKEVNELDETFMKYASHYGLGMVKDATINISVQLTSDPVSNMFVKCHTVLVDGFLGPEQIIEITPKLISNLIKRGLEDGWSPEKKGDYRMELAQKMMNGRKPVILQLPNMNEHISDYENLERPIEIIINS